MHVENYKYKSKKSKTYTNIWMYYGQDYKIQ